MGAVALSVTSSVAVGSSTARAAPPRTCSSGAPVHVVALGDTWFAIARDTGVSVAGCSS